MKPEVTKADAVLEPELRELVFDQDAVQRAKTAEKFMRWADQLTQSVIITNPDLVVMVPPPKVPRGFFLVNVSKHNLAEMRECARQCGVELRSMMYWAVIHVKSELQNKIKLAEQLGVKPKDCWRYVSVNPKN